MIFLRTGTLEIRVSGKSKVYCPTEKGKKYISRKLDDYKMVFQHVLGAGSEINADDTYQK